MKHKIVLSLLISLLSVFCYSQPRVNDPIYKFKFVSQPAREFVGWRYYEKDGQWRSHDKRLPESWIVIRNLRFYNFDTPDGLENYSLFVISQGDITCEEYASWLYGFLFRYSEFEALKNMKPGEELLIRTNICEYISDKNENEVIRLMFKRISQPASQVSELKFRREDEDTMRFLYKREGQGVSQRMKTEYYECSYAEFQKIFIEK